jgi:hypothetical protein
MPDTVYILWTDQAEYYFVCSTCFYEFAGMQWSGSTRSIYPDYKERAETDRRWHEQNGGACEFCGPKGNGGWSVNGRFPAAERRDERLMREGNERKHDPATSADGVNGHEGSTAE